MSPPVMATVLAAAIGSFPGGNDRIRAHALIYDLDFSSPVQGGDRRSVFGYVVADGDTAMIATPRCATRRRPTWSRHS